MNATLLVVAGKTTKRKVALTLPCVLGRSREADVTAAPPLISRRHCELAEQDGGLLMLRDLVSLNGTMIGGRRIASAPLLPNSEFTIGPLTFRVLYEFDGDLAVVPPICYADEANEAEIVNPVKASDSEVVEVADFATWADSEPEEVAPEMPVEPEPTVSHDKLATEPAPAEPDGSGGPTKESPWATDVPGNEEPKRPAAPPKQPNYGDDMNPEFGSFLEGLQ